MTYAIILVINLISFATAEFLVPVSLLPMVPNDPSIACLELPDDIVPEQISMANLPYSWRDRPCGTG